MSGNLARVLYDDEDVGEALVRPDGKLVEASAYDEREELMEGNEVPENHPRPVLPKRGRPPLVNAVENPFCGRADKILAEEDRILASFAKILANEGLVVAENFRPK